MTRADLLSIQTADESAPGSGAVRCALWLALLAVIAFCFGCAEQPPPPVRPAPLPPLLLHLPGIVGHLWVDDTYAQGIKDGGFSGDIEIRDWTHGDRGFSLFTIEENQKQAQAVADALAERYRLDPDSPLFISGHSGGGGVAVWALEKLPPGVRVRDAVLLSPALSPDYDLTAALRHVSGHIHVFYSANDNFVLGLGTSLFGNMDRSKGDAAGMVGFVRPQAGDATEYAKVAGHPYKSEWVWLGNNGSHIGPMAHTFVEQIVAPLLIADARRGPVKY